MKVSSGNHMRVEQLPYGAPIRAWLKERYGEAAAADIWEKTCAAYNGYLPELPDYGGKKNAHALAIYGGLLIFSLYPALPDQPPISEMQDFVQRLFMGAFIRLGKVINLNRKLDMRLINMVFRKVGDRDRRQARIWPATFRNVSAPYDNAQRACGYSFTSCPNADFAKKHDLLHVLPLLCNSDFFGIQQLHGKLIRTGTCGNSDKCDYCVVGDRQPLAAAYETEMDEGGFLVSRPVRQKGGHPCGSR